MEESPPPLGSAVGGAQKGGAESVSSQHRPEVCSKRTHAQKPIAALEKRGANGYNGPVVQLCCCAEWYRHSVQGGGVLAHPTACRLFGVSTVILIESPGKIKALQELFQGAVYFAPLPDLLLKGQWFVVVQLDKVGQLYLFGGGFLRVAPLGGVLYDVMDPAKKRRPGVGLVQLDIGILLGEADI